MQLGELIFSEDTIAPVIGAVGASYKSIFNRPGVLGGDMQDEMKEDLCLLKPQMRDTPDVCRRVGETTGSAKVAYSPPGAPS